MSYAICSWLLLESVVGTIVDPPTNPYNLSPVDFTFQAAANNSLTTARVFAHGINSTLALQPEQGKHFLQVFMHCMVLLPSFSFVQQCCNPAACLHRPELTTAWRWLLLTDPSFDFRAGQYNEKAFKALDYIIYRAGHYGIKLILTFADEWNTADSKINYLTWANATDNTNLFFTDATIQQYYKDHIHTIVNRNVSITTLWYKLCAAPDCCAASCLAVLPVHGGSDC